MLVKTARKPSSDPIQEKLRQDKANWNKKTSLFITRVLHFKKLMNGAPNLFFKQKSKITQPIPADPAGLLGALAHEFQEIAQQGSSIVEEQLAYSKNHRPKQPKAVELPQAPAVPAAPGAPPAAPAPDLGKQLAAWEQKYDLVAEGSNPLSRFLTRRITRTRGTSEKFRVNRMRLDMLSSCAKARKALGKLQLQIVKGNRESIAESQKIMQHVWNEWSVVARTFNNYKNKANPQPEKDMELPTEESMDPNKETLQDSISPAAPVVENNWPAPSAIKDTDEDIAAVINWAQYIVSDYNRNFRHLDEQDMGGYSSLFQTAILKYIKSPTAYKFKAAKTLDEEYYNVLKSINYSNGINATNFAQAIKLLEEKSKTPSQPPPVVPASPIATPAVKPLEAVAQAFVKKWLGKKRHQFFSQNTSSYRLEIFEMAKAARVDLNQIMNLLEKGLSVEQLQPLVSQVNKQMTNLRMMMRSLNLSEKPDASAGSVF